MNFGEITNSKHCLLMLVDAVMQLTHTSVTYSLDKIFEKERELLAYHRTKQTELLNQLYEVILSKRKALPYQEQFPPSVWDSQSAEILESSIVQIINLVLDSTANDLLNEEYLLSIDRFKEKLIKRIPDAVPETKVVIKVITKTINNPIQIWSKNEPKKIKKLKNTK